jgi:transposase
MTKSCRYSDLAGYRQAEWLKDTLEKLPTWPNSRIEKLLPLTPAMIEKLK